MKKNIFWIITFVLLGIYLVIQYLFVTDVDLSDNVVLFLFFTDLAANYVVVFGLGGILSLFLSMFLMTRKPFKVRLQQLFPLATSLVLLIVVSSFAYSAYAEKVLGVEMRPLTRYDSINIPQSFDCSAITDGKFETEEWIIERTGNQQFQIDKKTGETKEFTVEWINDCEYVIRPVTAPSKKMKVKIVSVTNDYYDCYISPETYAQRFRLLIN